MTSSHTQVAGAPSASEEGVDDMKPSSYSLIWFRRPPLPAPHLFARLSPGRGRLRRACHGVRFVLMRAIVMVGLVFYCKLIDRRHAAEGEPPLCLSQHDCPPHPSPIGARTRLDRSARGNPGVPGGNASPDQGTVGARGDG